jgi:hypothetical protein
MNAAQPPSGNGCAGCEEIGGWWFHLRRCVECGRVGCCDSSPSQHARRHYEETGHELIRTFEPGESWYWHYPSASFVDGPELPPPQHHPLDQPAPGPAGVVPADWRSRLNPR